MALVFEQFEPTEAEAKNDSLVLQKLVFIACNLATLALGLYKCRSAYMFVVCVSHSCADTRILQYFGSDTNGHS